MKKTLILSLILCCGLAIAQDVSIIASKIMPDSPAEKAGLLAGDRIVEIDDKPIRSADEAMLKLADADALIIELGRNGGGGP